MIVFFPLAGMLLLGLMPGERKGAIRWTAVALNLITFLLTLWLTFSYQAGPTDASGYAERFTVRAPWIERFSIEYYMACDGLSVMLVVLTGLLSFLAVFSAWKIEKGTKGFFIMYQLLVGGMMGVFVAHDLFLFYVFWEVMLLPMYFLIGIWGGPRKEYAAIKFFLFTLAGSVLMLLAMLAIYFEYAKTGHPFDIPWLIQHQPFAGNGMKQQLVWWAFFIGFAIKIPMFPFHTWLPDAHVEAPTAISVILAGVLLKMGGYGMLRICWPMFSDTTMGASWHWRTLDVVGVFALINIIYGAFCAMAQTDFKKLVAYSSISHMGYVLLGMAAMNREGVNGAVFQMFNHGLSSAAMFMLVGVVYERAHHREMARMGGLGLQMPRYMALAMVCFFSSLGLPGLNGFISEVMVFLGAFTAHPAAMTYPRLFTIIGTVGVVLTAAYILWCMQRVFLGAAKDEYKGFKDVNWHEALSITPLAALCIVFGILPNLMLNIFDGTMQHIIKISLGSAAQTAIKIAQLF
ncbi:MAG: NADH-quinone oxidoreductase subunit M [Candidatus Sumerlaeota bacterium]|nr:NADH-quinone oxidoreductase subunit M [Candidatus Sumerlaeota bacterium]